jgi:hypothetical protein
VTPFIFVAAAAAIAVNAIFLAFRHPEQFIHLKIAIVLFALGLPAYALFWHYNRKPSANSKA